MIRRMPRPLYALLLCATGAFAAAPTVHREERRMMDTVVTVAIVGEEEEAAYRASFDAAFAVFATVEQSMNEWLPDSPLWRVNQGAGKEAVAAPKPLCEVLAASLEGARRTRGLFDPTWAALRGLWRFGPGEATVPSAAEVKARCAKVDYRKVKLTPAPDGSCQVRLPEGMALGLGGVAKGWGVDKAVAVLRGLGHRDFFVQAGGDLYLAGKNGDRPWRAGIRDPRGPPESTLAMVELSDTAFSTSGDYERFFIKDQVRYHHLLDLRSCHPARASRSATVLAKTAMEAEFLTKATFVLGGKAGLALAESFGAEAVLVDAAGGLHVSPKLEPRLRRVK